MLAQPNRTQTMEEKQKDPQRKQEKPLQRKNSKQSKNLLPKSKGKEKEKERRATPLKKAKETINKYASR